MIITVTMNPAIDKTVEIDALKPGGLNRIRKVEYDAGGKGINVSKTIHELDARKIRHDFIWVDGETRTNTKVFEENGAVTELNEPGPAISEKQMQEFMKKLEGYAGEDTLIVLSGSIPGGVGKDIYARIIQMAHEKGSQVLMDADGEVFRLSLEAGPDMIKPNRVELEEYAGIDYRASGKELLEMTRKLMEKGVHTAAVSMGKSGAMFVKGGYEAVCPALSVKAHSTVGAGDAMVAALAYAWDQKLGDEETVRLCMAASAGAVTTVGTKPPAKELVEDLKMQVKIERAQ